MHGNAWYERIPEEPVISGAVGITRHASMKEVFASVEVWLLSLFLLFYVGYACFLPKSSLINVNFQMTQCGGVDVRKCSLTRFLLLTS